MKRIEKIDPGTLTGEPRKIFEQWSPGGKPLNIVLIYFRNIELNRSWSYMATHLFMKSSLLDRHREIVVLRASWQCASDYEFIQHVRIVREGGFLSDDEMRDLTRAKPASGWSALELALVAATDELVASNGIGDATWQALAKDLDAKQLIDVIATAGGYALNSMATSSFGIDIEDTMTREEGLSPSWNGPAFQFLDTDHELARIATGRIAAIEPDKLDETIRDRVAPYLERGERVNLLTTLANHPRLVRSWLPVIDYVDANNTLSLDERAMLSLRTAVQCDSRTEFADRAAYARRAGLSQEEIDVMRSDAPTIPNSPRRALIVEAVDELIATKVVGDELWSRLGEHFDDEEKMDIVFATATELMIAWMHNALGI